MDLRLTSVFHMDELINPCNKSVDFIKRHSVELLNLRLYHKIGGISVLWIKLNQFSEISLNTYVLNSIAHIAGTTMSYLFSSS